MAGKANRVKWGFFGATAWVFLGLLVPIQVLQLIKFPFFAGGINLWEWAHTLSGNTGLLLPFAAFAGGVAVGGPAHFRGLLARSVLVAAISFWALAYALPMTEYQAVAASGRDPSVTAPLGPWTLPVMVQARSTILADPPGEYSFLGDDPLAHPPNWWTYEIHTLLVVPLFAVLAALLGSLTGALTTGLSPPARRNTRWALGLASSLGFFLPLAWAGDFVRTDPSISGIWTNWLPFLVPAVELAALWALLRSRTNRLQAS